MNKRYVDVTRMDLVSSTRAGRDTLLSLLFVANRLRNIFLHGEREQYNFAGQYSNFTQANTLLIDALELWPNPQFSQVEPNEKFGPNRQLTERMITLRCSPSE